MSVQNAFQGLHGLLAKLILYDRKLRDLSQFEHGGKQDLIVLISQATVVEEILVDEIGIELKCAREGLDVANRGEVVHQTQLLVDDLGEQGNGQVAV